MFQSIVYAAQRHRNISMYQINGQTVLEEKYDENYEPTEEGVYYIFCHLAVCYGKVLFNLNQKMLYLSKVKVFEI